MPRVIDTYPTIEEVESACYEQICSWYRFLRMARNSNEQRIINLIYKKRNKFGGISSEISKRIGW